MMQGLLPVILTLSRETQYLCTLHVRCSGAACCYIASEVHEMKGDRDGKSAKTSATINCLYSAVVVKLIMF